MLMNANATPKSVHERVRHAVETIANTPPALRLLGSGAIQQFAFSPRSQRLQVAVQETVMSMPHIRQIMGLKPVKLAEHYAVILATMAFPPEVSHNISIVAISSRGRFHLLRRHPSDQYEAGGLDNVTGHVHNGETHEQTAKREIDEETKLPIKEMLASGAATLHYMGHFGWPMPLRTPEGRESSLVYGRMFILDAPDVEAHHIKLKPDEHTEVVTIKTSDIMRRINEFCSFDRFFFNVNFPRLGSIPLRA
jgi:8-oxo-dGTP pyrophosphatase MutT (NUDIX family)